MLRSGENSRWPRVQPFAVCCYLCSIGPARDRETSHEWWKSSLKPPVRPSMRFIVLRARKVRAAVKEDYDIQTVKKWLDRRDVGWAWRWSYAHVLNRGKLRGSSPADRLYDDRDRPLKLAAFVDRNRLDRLG